MKNRSLLWVVVLTGAAACFWNRNGSQDLRDIPFDPEPFALEEPADFVPMPIPEDNPLTVQGVALGRRLFYDPILSLDSTMSCAACHRQELAFTDARPVSIGVRGLTGRRSSPSLFNVGYYYKGLFWDGRVETLEEQAFHPVRDSLEMAYDWDAAVDRLQGHTAYPGLFRQAFGIEYAGQIDSFMVAKALAQFQRTLISKDSKFDRVRRGEEELTAREARGRHIFQDSSPELPASECLHCHADPLFTDLDFLNNGILTVEEQSRGQDKGRFSVTGRPSDLYKFRTPTLRNIALTAPYMHDGRFATLEEVIDHYASGGHFADNVDPKVRVLHLTEENKADLIAFLHTLTDSIALMNPAYSDPFSNLEQK